MVWYLFFTDIPKRKWPLFRRQIWTWKVSPRPPGLKVLIKRNNFLKLVYPVLFRGFQLFPVFASGFWSVNGFTVFSCDCPLLCFSVVSHSLPVNMKCYPVFKSIPKFYRTRTLISIPIQIPILIRFNTSFDADFISILTPISYRYRIHTDFVPIPIPISIPIPRFLGQKNTDTEPNSKSHTVSSLLRTPWSDSWSYYIPLMKEQ